jgi:hypothetical protein
VTGEFILAADGSPVPADVAATSKQHSDVQQHAAPRITGEVEAEFHGLVGG